MTPEEAAYDNWITNEMPQRHYDEQERLYDMANFPQSTVKIRRDDSFSNGCDNVTDMPISYWVSNGFCGDFAITNLKDAIRTKRRFLHWIKARRKLFFQPIERKHRRYTEEELKTYYPVACTVCGWKGLSSETMGGDDECVGSCLECDMSGFGMSFEVEGDEYAYAEQFNADGSDCPAYRERSRQILSTIIAEEGK